MSNMEIDLITFGNITEFIKVQKLTFESIEDTDELKIYLEMHYPKLKTMKYKLALDQKIIQTTTKLKNKATIAIMPPFSGG